jgi:aldose 1-epimerase
MPSVELIDEISQADHVFNLHRLTNDNGNSVSICNWGLSVQSVLVPDRAGEVGEVVIGYDDITKYRDNPVSFGATVGRYANRIGGARFSIDGEEYILPANDRSSNLHGGPRGLGQRPWTIRETGNDEKLAFLSATISSPDG